MRVIELDLIVAVFVISALIHACGAKKAGERRENLNLCLSGGLLGLWVEQAALRFGGTHCHASGILNVSVCSSLNSVLFYIPWVYFGVTTSKILSKGFQSWAFPFIAGMTFVGICAPYELQGPIMEWWWWPDRNTALTRAGVDIGPGTSDGMFASPHVMEALDERAFGVPVMAPYFHYAFGWGIAAALQIASRFGRRQSRAEVGLGKSVVSAVLLGPALGMVWDLLVRILHWTLGAPRTASAPVLILAGSLIPFLFNAPSGGLACGIWSRDKLLFWGPFAFSSAFAYNAIAGKGAEVIPGSLKLLVLAIVAVNLALHARASGLFMTTPASRRAVHDRDDHGDDGDGGHGDSDEGAVVVTPLRRSARRSSVRR